MKRISILVLVLLSVRVFTFAQSDAITRLFSQYEDDQNFTTISISPKMFKMMSKLKWNDVSPDVKNMINQLTGFKMLTTGIEGIRFYNEAIREFNRSSYDEMMSVKDGDEHVKFLVKEANGIVSELVMLVGSKSEFVLMSLTGIIDLDKINKLGEAINLKGMQNLKEINK